MFYYLKINNGYPFVIIGGQEEQIENYKQQFGNDIYEYECDIIPNRLVINEGVVCIPTETQLFNIEKENYVLPNGFYIKNSEVIPIPDNMEIMTKPIFDVNLEQWMESITLEEMKSIKRVELKNARDIEILSHYLYTNNHIYDADLDSRNRLFQAQQLGVGAETNINWITADNQVSSVSNDDLVNIVNGIAYREQQAFSKFSEKYQEVLNCSNVESIKNINW